MSFRNIHPLHILWQEGITPEMLQGVFGGVARTLYLAGVFKEFKIKHLGQRRQPDWHNKDAQLSPYQSLDWHIELARDNSKLADHLNSTVLLDSLKDNPTYKTDQRYELVVVKESLHLSHDSLRSVGGVARKKHGAVITIQPYLDILQSVNGESDEGKKKREFDYFLGTQLLTMHELGHTLGLYAEESGSADPTDEELKNLHCLNECVMYGPYNAELELRIKDKPFCPPCLEKLPRFFLEPWSVPFA